jgi:Na+/melibiose symporter-like transporter
MGFAVAPAVLSLLGAIVISGYTLDKPAHDAIRLELAKRDAG